MKGLIFVKKLIASLLCICLLISSFAFAAFGYSNRVEGKMSDYPVVFVPGYSSTALYVGDSFETGEQIWGLNMDLVVERVLANIIEIGKGLGALTIGNAQYIADVIGPELVAMLEKMKCNPDGSSTYDVKRCHITAEENNYKNLAEKYPDGSYRQELDMAAELETYIGIENIYTYTTDFRMGVEHCAKMLDEFIQSVKEYTGKNKVNLLAVSHGGQVTATYLTLYGYKDDVDNACLTVPAIGGAGFAYDLATAQVKLDEDCLLRFIEHGMRLEEDYDWLVKAHQLGFLDAVANNLIPYATEIMLYWGSIWDFMPSHKYEEAKAMLLDKEENAVLIAKSDRFHYEILPQISTKLNECIDNGMNISIIAGTGNRIVTGLDEDSDGIITTQCATGATCAPYGKRFADGYTQINPCDGKYKVSPSMNIDASTAYLPDNTWFVNGLFHGMTYWDNYTRKLLMTLVLTDNLTDVYSDEAFPQFRDTSNPSHTVYAEFNGDMPGYLSDESNALIITNVCSKGNVRIQSVTMDGTNLKFKINPLKTLKPGESVEIAFTGEVPEVSKLRSSLTICYTVDNITPVGYRHQYFTVMNGEAVEDEGGLRRAEAITPFDILIGDDFDAVLRKLGLKEAFSMLYTIMYYWIDTVVLGIFS